MAKNMGVVVHLRQHRVRDGEQAQQFIVPGAGVDIEELGPAGVGRVGCVHAAAGEAPQKKTVDRAEGQLACLRGGAGALHVIEDPAELGGGKIGIDQQAGARADQPLGALFAQAIADARGAAILPYDGVMDGFSARAIPDNDRFALVGNADGGDGIFFALDSLAGGRQRVAPDIFGIVFHPAAIGIMLGEFPPVGCQGAGVFVEEDGAGRCRALIDRQDTGFGRQARPPGSKVFASFFKKKASLPNRPPYAPYPDPRTV